MTSSRNPWDQAESCVLEEDITERNLAKLGWIWRMGCTSVDHHYEAYDGVVERK